jgi:hypothetical protein
MNQRMFLKVLSVFHCFFAISEKTRTVQCDVIG